VTVSNENAPSFEWRKAEVRQTTPQQKYADMTVPFRPAPRVASRAATHKEAEMALRLKTLVDLMQLYPTRKTDAGAASLSAAVGVWPATHHGDFALHARSPRSYDNGERNHHIVTS